MKTALELIANERQRQIEKEGYTAEHDDTQIKGELSLAAAWYAIPRLVRLKSILKDVVLWPWNPKYWKPTPGDSVRDLVKAGALIVAEIERLQRKEGKEA